MDKKVFDEITADHLKIYKWGNAVNEALGDMADRVDSIKVQVEKIEKSLGLIKKDLTVISEIADHNRLK